MSKSGYSKQFTEGDMGIEERAKEWLENNIAGGYYDSQLENLTALLKERDRITRNDCFDAVEKAVAAATLVHNCLDTVDGLVDSGAWKK